MILSEDNLYGITSKLEDILREEDPLGLIGAGAPHCEYDCEVPYLIDLLKEVRSAEELEARLPRLFKGRLGIGACVDSSLAARVWEVWSTRADDSSALPGS